MAPHKNLYPTYYVSRRRRRAPPNCNALKANTHKHTAGAAPWQQLSLSLSLSLQRPSYSLCYGLRSLSLSLCAESEVGKAPSNEAWRENERSQGRLEQEDSGCLGREKCFGGARSWQRNRYTIGKDFAMGGFLTDSFLPQPASSPTALLGWVVEERERGLFWWWLVFGGFWPHKMYIQYNTIPTIRTPRPHLASHSRAAFYKFR